MPTHDTKLAMLQRLFVSMLFAVVLYIALIIGPAWWFADAPLWPRGWLTIAILATVQTISGIWLLFTDPGLFHERTAVPRPKSIGDRLATGFLFFGILGLLALGPFDALVYEPLPKLPPHISLWLGLASFFFGAVILYWTFRVNSFAATVVKIQDDRDQSVIDTGPYAIVRHPMYMGMLPTFVGFALLMEATTLAVCSVPLLVVFLWPRILIEEATLKRELPGYADYLARVRSRIIPGIL